jgi:hypothetical protein
VEPRHREEHQPQPDRRQEVRRRLRLGPHLEVLQAHHQVEAILVHRGVGVNQVRRVQGERPHPRQLRDPHQEERPSLDPDWEEAFQALRIRAGP